MSSQNELTKEDYDRIDSYYSILPDPDNPKNDQQCVRMDVGPFKGVIFKFGKFQLAPPDAEGESTARYEYDILLVPPDLKDVEHTDEEGDEFEFMIGEILVKLLWDRYKQADAEEMNNPVTFVEDDESTDRAPDTISFDTQ